MPRHCRLLPSWHGNGLFALHGLGEWQCAAATDHYENPAVGRAMEIGGWHCIQGRAQLKGDGDMRCHNSCDVRMMSGS